MNRCLKTGACLAFPNPLAGFDWSRVRQAYGVFTQDPSQGVLHMLAAAQNSRWEQWVTQRLAKQAAPLAGRIVKVDPNALKSLPEDTLGGAYARHLFDQGFDPNAFSPSDQSAENWVSWRSALSHDVYHVLTGFDGTPAGEFGLAAFCVLQRWDPLNVFILTFVPWTCLGYPGQTLKILGNVWRGLWLGVTSRPLFTFPFEEHWHASLADVQQQLRLQS